MYTVYRKGCGLLGVQVYAREATTQLSTRSPRALIVVVDPQGRYPAAVARRATCAEHRRPCEELEAAHQCAAAGRPHTLQDDFARAAALHAALTVGGEPVLNTPKPVLHIHMNATKT